MRHATLKSYIKQLLVH